MDADLTAYCILLCRTDSAGAEVNPFASFETGRLCSAVNPRYHQYHRPRFDLPKRLERRAHGDGDLRDNLKAGLSLTLNHLFGAGEKMGGYRR